jgi:selenide,water dikinase
LAQVLRRLPKVTDRNVLVGPETRDDAAVYRLSDSEAIVETVDFFTPVVDEPYWFGRIAAANAFSDIWAMGARPLFALNLVCWPAKTLTLEALTEVVRGGADAAREAGAPILGGHSIDDPEPKYGLAVTGVVHPDRVLRNVGARPGDQLVLTKPLGSGIISTALKRGIAAPELVQRVTAVMAQLNKAAGEVFASSGAVSALTDITGFGLLGHGWEMAEGSGVRLHIRAGRVPVLEGVRALAAQDVLPGGSKANLGWVEPHLRLGGGVDHILASILADAQTNGGLLAAVAADRLEGVVAALRAAGVEPAHIGEVEEAQGEPAIEVTL